MNLNYLTISLGDFEAIVLPDCKKFLAVFFGQWCPFCTTNLPLVINKLKKEFNKMKVFLIDIKESDDVWAETGNRKYAFKQIPIYRFYEQQKIIYEAIKELDFQRLKELKLG